MRTLRARDFHTVVLLRSRQAGGSPKSQTIKGTWAVKTLRRSAIRMRQRISGTPITHTAHMIENVDIATVQTPAGAICEYEEL